MSENGSNPDPGHTGVVESTSVNSSGGGSLVFDSENGSLAGRYNLNVSGWVVGGDGLNYTTAWLHNTGAVQYITPHNDFNGDGLSDAMAFYDYGTDSSGNHSMGAQEWLSNPGATSLTYRYSQQVWPPTSGYTWSRAKWISGDFNGDGLSDAMAFYNYGSGSTGAQEWLSNPGTTSLIYHGSQEVWPQTTGYDWTKAAWLP